MYGLLPEFLLNKVFAETQGPPV